MACKVVKVVRPTKMVQAMAISFAIEVVGSSSLSEYVAKNDSNLVAQILKGGLVNSESFFFHIANTMKYNKICRSNLEEMRLHTKLRNGVLSMMLYLAILTPPRLTNYIVCDFSKVHRFFNRLFAYFRKVYS